MTPRTRDLLVAVLALLGGLAVLIAVARPVPPESTFTPAKESACES